MSILEAWLPILVIAGATKPRMINGTQKLMNCPEMWRIVTIMFRRAVQRKLPSIALRPRPIRIPATNATINLNGRLEVKLLLLLMIILPPTKN